LSRIFRAALEKFERRSATNAPETLWITKMKADDKIAVLVREMNAIFNWAELSAKLLAENASPAVQAARLAYLETIKPYKLGNFASATTKSTLF
jgi:hypothetical protein